MTTKTYYADKFNARYSFSESDYVDIPTRFSQFVDENKMIEIKMACREFKRRNPQYETWQDVLDALCIAVPNKGSDIMVDTTMQRSLLIDKCIARVDNFKVTKVMPVQVTPHPTEDKLVCGWDGQHTAILLYIICVCLCSESNGMNQYCLQLFTRPATRQRSERTLLDLMVRIRLR